MRLLFVCTGNICRSPTADAVARQRLQLAGLDWIVDSAGTGGWHAGEAPDTRAVEAAARRAIDMSGLRARELTGDDFRRFDHLVAMDAGHLRHMKRLRPGGAGVGAGGRISRLLDWTDTHTGQDVPDPYYGGEEGFDHVLDLVEAGIDSLIAALREGRSQPSG